MFAAMEKESRIRRNVERRLSQSIEFEIHAAFLAEIMPGSQTKVWARALKPAAIESSSSSNFSNEDEDEKDSAMTVIGNIAPNAPLAGLP